MMVYRSKWLGYILCETFHDGIPLWAVSCVFRDSHFHFQFWAQITHPRSSAYIDSAFYRIWYGKVSINFWAV